MCAKGLSEAKLSTSIDFNKSPAAKPKGLETGEDCGVILTKVSPYHRPFLLAFVFAEPKLLKVPNHPQCSTASRRPRK